MTVRPLPSVWILEKIRRLNRFLQFLPAGEDEQLPESDLTRHLKKAMPLAWQQKLTEARDLCRSKTILSQIGSHRWNEHHLESFGEFFLPFGFRGLRAGLGLELE